MTKNLLFFIALSALLPLALISCDNSSSPPVIPISIANSTSGNPNDWDGHGLSNLDEMNVHHTNPYDADTDGDGYNDYEEAVQLKNENTNKVQPLDCRHARSSNRNNRNYGNYSDHNYFRGTNATGVRHKVRQPNNNFYFVKFPVKKRFVGGRLYCRRVLHA